MTRQEENALALVNEHGTTDREAHPLEAALALAPQIRVATGTPRGLRRFTRILWVFVLATPFVLLLVPWRQSVRGEGRVVAYAPLQRQQAIEAPIDGVIKQWWVAEGSEVSQGDPLFQITDNDPKLLERLEGQLAALRLRKGAADTKVNSYKEQIVAYESARTSGMLAARERARMAVQRITEKERALDAANIAFETAQLNLDRQEQLKAEGLKSTRDYELARLAYRRTDAERDRAKASLEAARSDRRALEADVDRIDADWTAKVGSARASRESAISESASVNANILELQTRITRQQTQDVTAPMDGTVLRLMANQGGEFVKGGDPVVVLVPDTENMAVELLVDGNDMPLLSEGRRVRLQFEGWPAVQFAAWPSVAVGTFGGIVKLIDATDNGAARFRVVITPDPDDLPWPSRRFLRQGVQARGWVLLEQVTLGFELWRNLNGFPPVIADAEPKSSKR